MLRISFSGHLDADPERVRSFLRRRARRAGGRAAEAGESGPIDLGLHPAAEPVRLDVAPDGRLEGHARTSACGPGYHEHVCDLLAEVRRRFAPDLRVEDDADFFAVRDRPALERAIRDWRVAIGEKIAGAIRAGAGHEHVLFALPDGSKAHARGRRVVSALGVYTLEEWERATADVAAGRDLSRHFPWWGPGRDAWYWRNLGLSLLNVRHAPGEDARRERLSRALAACERALAIDPAIDLPRARLAHVARSLDDPERAARHLRAAVAERPGDHALRFELGLLLDDLGRRGEAAGVLEELLERRPRDAVVAYNAGLMRCMNEEYERAIELLGRAAEIAPRRAAIHSELAIALAGAGRFEDALRAVDRALDLGAPGSAIELREAILEARREADDEEEEGRGAQ